MLLFANLKDLYQIAILAEKKIDKSNRTSFHQLVMIEEKLTAILSYIEELETKEKEECMKEDPFGLTPLHTALIKKNNPLALMLLKHFSIELLNIQDKNGLTPLMIALHNDDFPMILHFKKLGLDLDGEHIRGGTLLHYAAFNDNLTLCKFLIEKLKVTVDTHCKNNGNTALHYAAMANSPEVIKYLLKKGAKINVINHNGYTPLQMAELHRSLAAIKKLKHAQDKLNLKLFETFSEAYSDGFHATEKKESKETKESIPFKQI